MKDYLAQIAGGNQALLLELDVLTIRARINRLQALEAEILANAAILADAQERKAHELLGDALERNYYETMYDHYRDANPAVLELMENHQVRLSKAAIEQVLRMPWSGDNYSANIWKREFHIGHRIKSMVTQNIIAGTSIERLTKQVADALGTDYRHAAKRLIHTETAFVKGQADMLVYERLGVEQYEFSAVLDRKTSEICQSLDGKHFAVKDAVPGLNYPPMHPHCRSITIAYREEKDGTKAAEDGEGNVISVPAHDL